MERIDTHFWSPVHNNMYSQNDMSRIFDIIRERKLYNCPSLRFCYDCLELIEDNDLRCGCRLCNKQWHPGCIPSSPDDINSPFHTCHPLKLLIDGPPDYSNKKCDACQEELKNYFYHCSICDFSMHVRCSNNPPPLILETPECHEHTLTCMVRNDTFTCNACGTRGERWPYVCVPCGLMFHRECINLPHVININRHDHRVSHTSSLGFGNWKCMICQKKVNWRRSGAYSCSTCPGSVAHSKCATRGDVWDGGTTICHFSHEEHYLIKIDAQRDGRMRCEACVHPIFSEKHYMCMECDFIIHETCANLPLRKRHWLSAKPFSLNVNKDKSKSFFRCDACKTRSNGFRYESEGVSLDMRCALVISLYCDYECHPHTLFLTTTDKGTCGACELPEKYVLRCTESECDFSLCLACATLPKKIKRKAYEHFLVLRHGEKASGKYWCEVCETVLDPQKWFYTCDVSGVTFHVQCVVGEFPNAKPGVTYHYQSVLGEGPPHMYPRVSATSNDGEEKIELFPNDCITRPVPKCAICGSRCLRPLIIKLCLVDTDEVYCCDVKVKCSHQFLWNTKYTGRAGLKTMF
ncbi:hypothetical protein Bca4012_067024 [Brassica carinata]|uniref:Zinc finger PHD-type domain-containing protein n=1 Tax=Brassica carinata TaxID=52824 RepID=A0A8X7VS95_BRACI|nr:hypothetical protein Bca52824_019335 [Brassica carinata]